MPMGHSTQEYSNHIAYKYITRVHNNTETKDITMFAGPSIISVVRSCFHLDLYSPRLENTQTKVPGTATK